MGSDRRPGRLLWSVRRRNLDIKVFSGNMLHLAVRIYLPGSVVVHASARMATRRDESLVFHGGCSIYHRAPE